MDPELRASALPSRLHLGLRGERRYRRDNWLSRALSGRSEGSAGAAG